MDEKKHLSMNKKLLLLAITLPLSLASFSQQQWYKHNIDVTAGGGLQSIQFKPEEGDQKPLWGAVLNGNYRYMFNKHWGIGGGIGLDFYNARSVYDDLVLSQKGLVHEDNEEPYEFKSNFNDWKETQRLLDFEVPVAAYYMRPINEKWNFIGDLGVKLNIPLCNKYKIKDGTLKTTGYFEKATNIEYENLPQHGFDTYTSFTGKSDLRKVGASAFLDAGVLHPLKDNMSLYLGVYFAYRFTNLATESNDLLYDGQTREYVGVMSSNFVDKAHVISAGAKVGLSFGLPNPYRKDSDKDGVVDAYDQCPETPEGVKVDSIGCPLDSDGDGVVDYLDQCPETPEGITVDSVGCPLDEDGDGIADYLDQCSGTPDGVKVDAKGCPLDSDGDGVADYLDKCPETPADAKVDANGCPLDSDGDGVPDYLDQCPDIAGEKENNGCPVVKQEVAQIFKQALKGIQFETGKSVIKKSSYGILNQVVDVMIQNPNYNLIISGHTDNVGNPQMNMKLSDDRANSVMKYLLDKGIAANRMTAKGYGDTEPIADNATASGREQNRRVQFEVEYVK